MSSPSPEAIADIVLGRRPVYGLDIDSKIRQAANRLTARALLEILGRLDDQDINFPSRLSELLAEFGGEDASYLIGFDAGAIPSAEDIAMPASRDIGVSEALRERAYARKRKSDAGEHDQDAHNST